MTALAPVMSPARQPFASLDATRLRSLGNVKNRQNGKSEPQEEHLAVFCSNQAVVVSKTCN
jgi:hypothetical protein